MARAKKTTKKKAAASGRGSEEAIRKRRAARNFNTLLTSSTSGEKKLDGRTEKRRQRLVEELKGGKGGKELKPNELLDRMNQLLEIGETLSSLRKQGVKPRPVELDEARTEACEALQAEYGYAPGAWKILGIDMGEDGKVVVAKPKKRGRRTSRK